MRVRVRKFKDKLGVALPDRLVASLGWAPGDILEVEVENDGLKTVRVETAFDRCRSVVEKAMDEYRDALQALAKS